MKTGNIFSKDKRAFFRVILIVFICTVFYSRDSFRKCYAEKNTLLPGVVHIHSTISNGEVTPEEIVELAREKGMKVVIFTDHDTMKWRYGIPPLRNIVQITLDQNSILKYGAARYIDRIEELNEKYPDMVILHGSESIPFYYWQGSYLTKDLALASGDEHIMVLGLKTPSDYKDLPSIGNGYPGKYDLESIFGLWPVGFLLLGWYCISLRRRIPSQRKSRGMISGIILLFLGTLFLANNFPFKTPVFDQYHGKQGTKPFQYLIDHANEKGALTFWAHPEVEHSSDINGIKILKAPYDEDLLSTYNYTGLAVLSEGMRRVGPPGGIWDKILLQYCSGEREKPAWVIGEVDYKVRLFSIDETQTVFLVKEKNEEAILNALRTGKMYATMGSTTSLTLNSFVVEDVDSGKLAFMGDEIRMKGRPRIRIVVTVEETEKPSEYEKRGFKIDLIRNGSTIKTFDTDGSIDIVYDDDYYNPNEKVYYRLAVDTSYLFRGIISNPVFVQFEEKE